MDDDEVPLCPLCLAWPPLVRKQPSLTTSSICVTFQPLASLFINIACFPFLFNNLIPTETPMIEPTVIAACLPLRPKSSDGARQSSDGCDLKLRLRVPPQDVTLSCSLPLGQSGRPTLSCPRRRTISDCSILKCGLPGKNRTRNIPITTQTEPLLRRDLGGDRSDPEFSLQHPFLTLMTLWHPMNEQLLRRSDESMPQYYTYSMQQLKDAIINIHPPNRTILPSQDLTHTPCRIIDLYKVKEGVSMGNLLTIIKQINKKNIQNKHMHLIHYQRVELLASKDIPLKRVQPGQYLAMIRANQPLVRQKRILMTLKQKIDYMLAIAKAVQSLHTTRRSNFGLNLRQIYTSSSGQIKIGSNFNAQIARLVFNKSRQPSFAPDSPEQKRMFDIWCLAVVFIQIMINGRLVIKWQDYSQTLLSIKALLRYTTHIFFYAVRSLLRKMLRQGERQIDINRVVRKLKKMSRVTEEQLKASEPPLRQMALSLISKGPPIIPQSLITETNQRIVIVDAFQVFLTFYQQQQLIVIEIIHPETDCLVVTAKYTFQSLPKNIRSKHKNLLSFFRFIQYLHPNSFSLTKEGLLSLSPL